MTNCSSIPSGSRSTLSLDGQTSIIWPPLPAHPQIGFIFYHAPILYFYPKFTPSLCTPFLQGALPTHKHTQPAPASAICSPFSLLSAYLTLLIQGPNKSHLFHKDFSSFSRPGFVSLGTIDSLLWGLSCARRMFRGVPGLHPLDVSSTLPRVTTKQSPDIAKGSLGGEDCPWLKITALDPGWRWGAGSGGKLWPLDPI